MTKKKVLFICGSMNQTSQLHQIAGELPEVDAFFTPFYGDALVDGMRRLGLIEISIGGNKRRGWCVDYLKKHGLAIDMHGARGGYDLVVSGTDMLVQKNVRDSKLIIVQEGILDPERFLYRLVHRLRFLPRWIAGTSTTGMSYLYDRLCCASEGYRAHFIGHGADPEKVVVTGIPNFDDCERYRKNDFPHRGYVLVCTSDTRETFKLERPRAPRSPRAWRSPRAGSSSSSSTPTRTRPARRGYRAHRAGRAGLSTGQRRGDDRQLRRPHHPVVVHGVRGDGAGEGGLLRTST